MVANHPVKDFERNVVMITSQNHGFAVDEANCQSKLKVTHKSLFDGIHSRYSPYR